VPVLLHPSEWINWPLVKEPLNWAIVGVVASLWLLVFHLVMTAFGAMQGNSGVNQQAIGGGGPGSIAAAQAGGTVSQTFSIPGNAGMGDVPVTSTSWFGNDNIWTDGFESKYAEDGWVGNP
jgi:hypothetical protein